MLGMDFVVRDSELIHYYHHLPKVESTTLVSVKQESKKKKEKPILCRKSGRV